MKKIFLILIFLIIISTVNAGTALKITKEKNYFSINERVNFQISNEIDIKNISVTILDSNRREIKKVTTLKQTTFNSYLGFYDIGRKEKLGKYYIIVLLEDAEGTFVVRDTYNVIFPIDTGKVVKDFKEFLAIFKKVPRFITEIYKIG